MKKVLTVILSCFLVLGLTACGSNDSLNSGSSHSKSSSSTYKTPIEYFCQGASKQDLATFKKAFDDIVLRVYAEDIEQDFYDAIASTIEEYGTYTMTCEVGKITYEATAEDLQELNDYYEQEYGESVSFTAGYSVEVKATISGSLDEDTETASVDVVKYNGKWYILDYFLKEIHTSTTAFQELQETSFRDDVLEIFKVAETAYTEKSIRNDGSIKVEGNNKKFCATLTRLKEDGYLNKELHDINGNPVWQGWVEVSVPINGQGIATYTATVTNNKFYLVGVERSQVLHTELNDGKNTKNQFTDANMPSYCLTVDGK